MFEPILFCLFIFFFPQKIHLIIYHNNNYSNIFLLIILIFFLIEAKDEDGGFTLLCECKSNSKVSSKDETKKEGKKDSKKDTKRVSRKEISKVELTPQSFDVTQEEIFALYDKNASAMYVHYYYELTMSMDGFFIGDIEEVITHTRNKTYEVKFYVLNPLINNEIDHISIRFEEDRLKEITKCLETRSCPYCVEGVLNKHVRVEDKSKCKHVIILNNYRILEGYTDNDLRKIALENSKECNF